MSSQAEAIGGGRRVVRARVAVTAVFFLFGINVGLWAAHIPVVQARLDITPGMLGLALLAAAVGTIVGQPALGMLMARIGSRLPTIVLPATAAISAVLIIASPTVPFLFVLAFAIGVFWGGMAVAMNTQASEIEVLRGKPTMSTFHAAASLGMLAGATLGGLIIGQGWGNGQGAAVVAVLAIATSLVAARDLIHDEPCERRPAFVMPSRSVLGIGILAFLMFLIEGGMIDWSALFLAIEKGASPAWAAAGFAFFTGAMALFRAIGNRIVAALGRKRTVVIGGLTTAAGIFFAVVAPWPLLSACGFLLVGAGAANVVPILMSTAAQTPGAAPSVSIGAVSSMMTAGLLVGPPLIGFVSDAFGLSVGVSLMGIVGIAVAVAAAMRPWEAAPRG